MSVTLLIIILTCLVSYQAFNRPELSRALRHSPYIESRTGQYWRMLTSGFIHGGWLHLGVNMFVFYSFGQLVENTFLMHFGATMGRVNFLLLYLLAIVFADIPTFLKHKTNPHFASVGASGAVSAILFASILFSPWNPIYLYGIIKIPGIVAGLAYLIYSSWAGKKMKDYIDHDAHFWGAVFGFVFTILLKPSFFTNFVQLLKSGWPF